MKTVFYAVLVASLCAVPALAQDNMTMSNESGMDAGNACFGTGQNDTGMGAALGANTSAAMGGGNMTDNITGTAYSMGVEKNETGQGGVSNESNMTGLGAGMGPGEAEGADGAYTYEQKDRMIADVREQLKQMDMRIETAKRQGDNDTARNLQQDRDRLKKQLNELKKANRDNWERVSNTTMDMMNQMDLSM